MKSLIDKLSFFDELKQLNWPREEFVICGSAILVLKGIIEKNDDLDVTVTNRLWNQLKEKNEVHQKYIKGILKNYMEIGNIEIMNTTDGVYGKYASVEKMILNAEYIDGYHVTNLEDTIYYKKYLNRKNDLKHLELIQKYLDISKRNN